MVRKQTLAVLVVLMTLVAPAFGLGLGDINVKSNLNDPLEAEINLIQLQGLTAGEVLPTLASNDDFRRAGIDRNFFLANIQFRIEENESGQLVVAMTTKQAVREPFLNFLVEVNWPGGRLLKEFTILLDPPIFDSDLSVDALVVESITSSPVGPTDIATNTVVEAQQTPQTVTAVEAVTPRTEALSLNEYRVKRDDTLWEIALAVPDRAGYSPQQVMLAIQDLNPEAFLNNNINRLKAGSVLTLPDSAQISARSLDVAINEVQAQNRGSAPNLRAPVNSTGEVQLSATETTSSALPSDDGERDPDGYLELAADSEAETTTASGEAGASVDQLQSQLATAEELNDQYVRERNELASRVEELQAQIEIMERMVNIQSSELADVQQVLTQPEETATESLAAATDTSADTIDSVSSDLSDNNEATPLVEPAVIEAPVAEAPAPVTEEPAPVVEEPAPIVAPTPEPTLMEKATDISRTASDWVMASVANMAIAGAGLLLLLILPFYIRSKRGNGNKTLSELTEAPDEIQDVNDFEPAFDEDLLVDSEDEEDDFLGDDEPESLDAVVEAEMYMAYQKYDQAEEKLKEAFAAHPDRMDVGLKLLEVYAEMGDANAFNALESRLSLNAAQQQTAAALTSKLPLLDETGDSVLEDDFNGSDYNLDDELDLDEATDSSNITDLSNEELGAALNLEEDTDDLDFNLDLDAPIASDIEIPEDKPYESLSSTDELSEDLDFTLDLDSSDESNDLVLNEGSLDLEVESDSDALDFTLDMEDDGDVLSSSVDADESIDFDSSDTDFNLDTDFSLNDNKEDEFESGDLELSLGSELSVDEDVSLDLDDEPDQVEEEPVVLAPVSDPLQDLTDSLDSDAELEDDEFDFLSGSDEASTKLDLARAYIEMEDKEGAQDILEEVVQEGTDEQKALAQELISKL